MIECYKCGKTAEGDSRYGKSIADAGFFVLLAQDMNRSWNIMCPDCWNKAVELAKALDDYLGHIRWVMLDSIIRNN